MKSVNGDTRDQSEAADALTGACCANANTTKGCVTLWFAVSYKATFAGCLASGETSPPVPKLEGLFITNMEMFTVLASSIYVAFTFTGFPSEACLTPNTFQTFCPQVCVVLTVYHLFTLSNFAFYSHFLAPFCSLNVFFFQYLFQPRSSRRQTWKSFSSMYMQK